MQDLTDTPGVRHSVASTAVTGSFHDALEEQLTARRHGSISSGCLSFQTAEGALETGGEMSTAEPTPRIDLPEAAPQRCWEDPAAKQGRRTGPARFWKKKRKQRPGADTRTSKADGSGDDFDDFGFRYRPAIGPPRPLLKGGAVATASPPMAPPAAVAAEPLYDLRAEVDIGVVHYYYDNRLMLSGGGDADAEDVETPTPRTLPPQPLPPSEATQNNEIPPGSSCCWAIWLNRLRRCMED